MKKFKKIAYVILIAIIIILSFVIYINASNNGDEDTSQNDKVVSELEYIESMLLDLFNTLNNIETRNYSIKVSEIQNNNNSKKSSSSSNSSSEEGKSSGGSEESSGRRRK